jgi:hypothetical protein
VEYPPNENPPSKQPAVITVSGTGTIQPGYTLKIFVYGSGSHLYYRQSDRLVNDGASWAVKGVNIGDDSSTSDDGSLFTIYVLLLNESTDSQMWLSPGPAGGYSQDEWESWFADFKVAQVTVQRVS